MIQLGEEEPIALVSCSDCGRQVSDRATACPQCGAPLGAAGQLTSEPSLEEWARSQLTAGSPRRQVVDQIVRHGSMLRTDADALVKRLEGEWLVPSRRVSAPIVIAAMGTAMFFLIFLLLLFARAG